MSDIICVTNRRLCREDFLERMEKVTAMRPKAVILREKDLSEEEYTDLAEKVMEICKRHDVPCILHTFINAAVKLGADSIHLPLPVLREMSAEDKKKFRIIGSSCHSAEDALEAESLGATYITAGHVFATDCKKGLPPRGLDFLKAVCESVDIPVYAIGGISLEKMPQVLEAGAAGGCIMSGFMNDKGESMNITKEQLKLYAVTDRTWLGGRSLEEAVEQAILGGVTCVQLREKDMDEDELIEEASKLVKICHKHNVPLIVNDNFIAAMKSGADGVHVGIEDAPVKEIRRIAGKSFIIGATAKTVEQAKRAEAEGADYLGVGAVFPSPTKKNAVRITPDMLREICGSVKIPAVAIGGISHDNVHEINGCGQAGIAVVSAIFAAEDIKSAAEGLLMHNA